VSQKKLSQFLDTVAGFRGNTSGMKRKKRREKGREKGNSEKKKDKN